MELWTEYEGKVIDGVFPLTRLLRPEGNSAFFTSSSEDGRQRVIRLIESAPAGEDTVQPSPNGSSPNNDDILTRWRAVAALDHPNILKFEDFGQFAVDQASLVYAVMEPIDANLGEVVGVHRLTLPDTRQVAVSLLSVLGALHSHGFVHGHVQPLQVVAVGEVVKLQCDCIGDAPEGLPGQELKKRDVHDLAVLLLQALTKEPTLEAARPHLPLPAPFDAVVKKGLSGEWGLAEIAAALEVAPLPKIVSIPVNPSAAPVAAELDSSPALEPEKETATSSTGSTADIRDRALVPDDEEPDLSRLTGLVAVAITIAVLIIMVFTWQFLPKLPGKPGTAAPATTVASSNPASANAAKPLPPVTAANAPASTITPAAHSDTSADHSATAAPTSPASNGQWRVVAYQYRHERQARKKTLEIARRHPQLHPSVFHPRQSGPYFVTIGGEMDREQALALAKKAHREGLPRRTYARNEGGEREH